MAREFQAVSFLLACDTFIVNPSKIQRRQQTHSDSRAATFRDRKRAAVSTRSLNPHHSTKQYNKRHVAIAAQVKALEEA